jgi:hypothetical protein
MPGPVVLVKTSEIAQSAGVSLSTGTAFIVAPAAYGPETPTEVRSLGEGIALYGPREGESVKLYDVLNTFFALGGAKAWVNRTAGEGGPLAAKLELETAGKKKTLVVSAKYKGTYGNSIKVEVVESGANTKLVILSPEGEVLEASGEYPKAEELLAWGKTHEAYVVITEGSEYAGGKGEKLEKLASTKLASGANPTVNEKSTIKTIEGFGKSLGPGQLIVPGNTEEKVHTAMAEHCLTSKRNRIALADLKKAEETNATVSGLKGEKGTYAIELQKKILFFSSAATVQGVTLGTTRTVPASVVVAGLCAQVAATGNDNQAPAGKTWPLSPFVLGFTNAFNQEQVEELSTAGVNSFKEVQGIPCLYGFVTACSKEKDLIFWQASASREQMALVASAEQIGASYLFKTIDGRKRLLARFQGDLQALVKRHWENNALFGETAPEAGLVNVGEPVNTLTTIQNGELNAELIVRISPYANVVSIVITSVPITEAA